MHLIQNFDLTPRNTLGLHSKAAYGAVLTDAYQIGSLVEAATSVNKPLHVVGAGSNLVLRERIEGVVAIMASKGRSVIGTRGGNVLVKAQAGGDWPEFVEWTVSQGLGGLENLAGIPGTVGAAPVQNIGAYGVELAQRFYALTAYDVLRHKLRTFRLEDCGFRYRHSIFKEVPGRFIILDVIFALPTPWRPTRDYAGLDTLSESADALAIMECVLRLRQQKLPDWREIGNAGSFFHNPVVTTEVADGICGVPRHVQSYGTAKLSAAWLIERCGRKGHREGHAGIYEKHSLILVNHGGATYEEIARLSVGTIEAVRNLFGVELTQEPMVL